MNKLDLEKFDLVEIDLSSGKKAYVENHVVYADPENLGGVWGRAIELFREKINEDVLAFKASPVARLIGGVDKILGTDGVNTTAKALWGREVPNSRLVYAEDIYLVLTSVREKLLVGLGLDTERFEVRNITDKVYFGFGKKFGWKSSRVDTISSTTRLGNMMLALYLKDNLEEQFCYYCQKTLHARPVCVCRHKPGLERLMIVEK